MKSLKLIGLALGASLSLSTAAFAEDITVAVAGPMTGGESAFGLPDRIERAIERQPIEIVRDHNVARCADNLIELKVGADGEIGRGDLCDPALRAIGHQHDIRRRDQGGQIADPPRDLVRHPSPPQIVGPRRPHRG